MDWTATSSAAAAGGASSASISSRRLYSLGCAACFAKRARAILTLLTLVIAGSAFLAVQTTAYSFGTFLDQVFTAYHFDILVSVPVPFAFSAMNLLWMLIFIVLVATVASVGPAWGAARVKIAQTLRYE